MSTQVGNAAERVLSALDLDFEMRVQKVCEAFAEYCESPIEVMFGSAFFLVCDLQSSGFVKVILPDASESEPNSSTVKIHPQYIWEDYRVDFLIQFENVFVVVECDGHDFHERTKEQAQADRERDRRIQQAGWPILRFTGSEIFRNPRECVSQVVKFIRSRLSA